MLVKLTKPVITFDGETSLPIGTPGTLTHTPGGTPIFRPRLGGGMAQLNGADDYTQAFEIPTHWSRQWDARDTLAARVIAKPRSSRWGQRSILTPLGLAVMMGVACVLVAVALAAA